MATAQEPKYSREELLYLARLAEQCDRFDGKYLNLKTNYWFRNG